MGVQRPFRFGVLAGNVKTRAEWVTKARNVEDLGYATFLMLDHLNVDFPPIAALMSAADATSTLRIGSCVFSNDYRHPVVLAKEVATLDVLSEGRFEFGIGAGWQHSEYEQVGLAFDPPGKRIRRLEESLRIMKGLFTDKAVTLHGEYYNVNELQGQPSPIQNPHPPIYMGGGGKRMLSFAAREADIVGIVPIAREDTSWQDMSDGLPAATTQKIEWIRQAAGARFDQLELQTSVFVVIVTDYRKQVAERMASNFGMTGEQVLGLTHCLLGTVDQISEDLLHRREQYGISYIVILDKDMEAFAPVVARLAGK